MQRVNYYHISSPNPNRPKESTMLKLIALIFFVLIVYAVIVNLFGAYLMG